MLDNVSENLHLNSVWQNWKWFGIKYKIMDIQMETGDHPEMDESDLVDQEQIAQYQMIIGSLQWDVTLGRY